MDQDVSPFDPRKWALVVAFGSFLLSFISLLWTNHVRRESEARDKTIRENTVLREQFLESVGRPLDRILDELQEVSEKLIIIADSQTVSPQIVDDVGELNRSLVECHGRLMRKLRNASDSTLVQGADWAALSSEFFDNACDKLNAAYNPTMQSAAKCKALKAASEEIDALCKAVRRRVEEALTRHIV